MKYIFIVNEGAGKGKSQKILPKIEEECQKRKYDYEIRKITKENSHICRFANECGGNCSGCHK